MPHLTQHELSRKDKDILAGLEDWLSHAVFDSKNNICIDARLSEKWELLCGMDLIKEVRALLLARLSTNDFLVHVARLPNQTSPSPWPSKAFRSQGPSESRSTTLYDTITSNTRTSNGLWAGRRTKEKGSATGSRLDNIYHGRGGGFASRRHPVHNFSTTWLVSKTNPHRSPVA